MLLLLLVYFITIIIIIIIIIISGVVGFHVQHAVSFRISNVSMVFNTILQKVDQF